MSKRFAVLMGVIACALLLSAPTFAAQETDISGEWVLTMNMPMGGGRTFTGTLTLEVADGEITGTYQREGAENASEVTGKIEGDEITFTMAGMGGGRRPGGGGGGGGARQITFTGKVEGEGMSGTVSFGRGEGTWTAERPE